MLSSIRIVCVATSHPGNIGGVARAMKNMGLSQLYLVNPQSFPHADASARAVGADDLLTKAIVTDNLTDALQGCGLVIGTSARARNLSLPTLTARDCAARAWQESSQTSVAIVFGREHAGLTNEELQRCHYQVQIPCDPNFSSLNLAAAVQIITYELYVASQQTSAENASTSTTLATADEMEKYYIHLNQTLIDIQFLDPNEPKRLMERLRRLYNRARPDKVELNILRGILTAVGKLVNSKTKSSLPPLAGEG